VILSRNGDRDRDRQGKTCHRFHATDYARIDRAKAPATWDTVVLP
jgi:hypothetical protein